MHGGSWAVAGASAPASLAAEVEEGDDGAGGLQQRAEEERQADAHVAARQVRDGAQQRARPMVGASTAIRLFSDATEPGVCPASARRRRWT